MCSYKGNEELPDSNSPNLYLTSPTAEEKIQIWTSTADEWKDSLTLPLYLEESEYLTTVPLAKDGQMTKWILSDKTRQPNDRPILCSCETFRKHSWRSDATGDVQDVIIHGVASVFSALPYRRRGYAGRLMTELANSLRVYQAESPVIGSVLYSDIGKKYYASFGWHPNITNFQFEFTPAHVQWPQLAKEVREDQMAALCKRDETLLKKAMSTSTTDSRPRVSIIPDLNHMLWHIAKEDFATKFLFGKVPSAKGAIAGNPGNQIWAIWTHRYYDHPDGENPSNVLYFLRLVAENDQTCNHFLTDEEQESQIYREQLESLSAILQAAQYQASEWKLEKIKVWEPSPLLQDLIARCGVEHERVDREKSSIASGLWYNDLGQPSDIESAPNWINNEHYAWC
jgi:hypothetical protein